MESIEERANRIAGVHPDWSPVECMRRGYIEGAKEEHKLLTEWHDPKEELPEDEETVLLLIESNILFSKYMTGSHFGEEWLTQEGDPLPDGATIIGWREIHE